MTGHRQPGVDQVQRADRQVLGGDADDDEFARRAQTADGRGHRGGVVAVASTTAAPPSFCSSAATSCAGGVDVVMCAQLRGFLGLAGAPGDRDRLEAHRPGQLHAEVTQPADAEDRDQVAGLARV